MGWGVKRAVPATQPERVDLSAEAMTVEGFERPPFVAKRVPVPKPEFVEGPFEGEDEKPDPERLAEIEYMRLTGNKGWLIERKENELRNFLRERALYKDACDFIRRKR